MCQQGNHLLYMLDGFGDCFSKAFSSMFFFLEMNTNILKFLVSLGLTIIPEALNTLKKHSLLQQYSYTFWLKQGAVVVSLVSHKVSGSSSTLSSGILLYTSSSFVNHLWRAIIAFSSLFVCLEGASHQYFIFFLIAYLGLRLLLHCKKIVI